jgi:hypothetical protein
MVPSAETPRAIQPDTLASILAKRVSLLNIRIDIGMGFYEIVHENL